LPSTHARVRQLPVSDAEKDYLRLAEIERYLEGCAAHYRPLAEFLIGTGTRISEALDVRWRDIDWDARAVRIYRQRDRQATGSARPKGRRFRSVAIGPGLVDELQHIRARSAAAQPDNWVFLCPPARRRPLRRSPIADRSARRTAHGLVTIELVGGVVPSSRTCKPTQRKPTRRPSARYSKRSTGASQAARASHANRARFPATVGLVTCLILLT
jgi:integrase